jgi:hypothetical protein
MSGAEPELLVTKAVGYIAISDELAMEYGLIPDTRPPPPPIPWRTRLRWRWGEARDRAAERAYRLIAGREIPGGDE